MRHPRFLLIASAFTAVLSAAWASGCGTTYDDCVTGKIGACKGIYTETTATGTGGGSTTTTTTTTTTTGSGGTGGTGGSAPSCVGDPTLDATLLTKKECLAFVRSDAADDQGDGSQDKPYKLLQAAIDKAEGRWVIACINGSFTESVIITSGAQVYGGFDCDNAWAWAPAARSRLDGPKDTIALTLTSGAMGAKVKSFQVSAADATVPGGSSIAVSVADVDAEITNSDVSAGSGMKGEDGALPVPAAAKNGDSAMDPSASSACVVDAAVAGGLPGTTVCDDGTSAGGLGGLGGKIGIDSGNGQAGADGTPAPNPNPGNTGLGGAGQGALACVAGTDGQPGDQGNPGSPDMTPGELSSSGISGGDGSPGIPGHSGQGGGGGGGAKGGTLCGQVANPVDGPGASGGGGGAGGCGGKGGLGGKAGGSSLGIISLGLSLKLSSLTITTASGGFGGNGNVGQDGGDSGVGAPGGAKGSIQGSVKGCKGGDGGIGGFGGQGAGGRGGHSIGIAYAKTPLAKPDATITTGTGGKGGSAGLGAPAVSDGSSGIGDLKGACWDFATNTSCP